MIVEACQGAILGDFCGEAADRSLTCAFHQAGAELHDAVVRVLSRWTLADFLDRPAPDPTIAHEVPCWLAPCPRRTSRVTVGSEIDSTAFPFGSVVDPSQPREEGP
jgi:hypothetical protein